LEIERLQGEKTMKKKKQNARPWSTEDILEYYILYSDLSLRTKKRVRESFKKIGYGIIFLK